MRSSDHLSPQHLLRAIIVVQCEMYLAHEKPGSDKHTAHEKYRQRLLFRVRRQWAALHKLDADDFPWNLDCITDQFTAFRKEPPPGKTQIVRELWPREIPAPVAAALNLPAAANGQRALEIH